MKDFAAPLFILVIIVLIAAYQYGGLDLFHKVTPPKNDKHDQKNIAQKDGIRKLVNNINQKIKNSQFSKALKLIKILENERAPHKITAVLKGICYSGKGDFSSSLKTFESLLKESPKNPVFLVTAGRLAYRLGEYKLALKRLKQLPRKSKYLDSIQPELMRTYLHLGNLDEGLPRVKSIIAKADRDEQEELLSLLLSAVSEPAELKNLGVVFDTFFRDTGKTFFLYASAEVDYSLGKEKEALSKFNRLLRKEKKNQKARMRMATIIFNRGDLKTASRMFSKIMGYFPELATTYWELGRYTIQRDDLPRLKQKRLAFEFFIAALIEDQKFLREDDSGVLSWGRDYYQEQLSKNRKDGQARYYLSLLLLLDRKYKQAQREFKTLLVTKAVKGTKRRIIKTYYNSLLQRARMVADRKRAERERENISRQWELYNRRVAENRRRARIINGQQATENKSLKKRLLERVNRNPQDARANYHLGMYLAEHGKEDEGLQYLRSAERIDEKSPQLPYAMGKIELSRGLKNNAMEHFQRALKKDPYHGPTLLSLAQISFRSGKREKAVSYLKSSLAGNPVNVEAQFLMAEVLNRQGDLNSAKKYYRRVIALDPDSDKATEARAVLGID